MSPPPSQTMPMYYQADESSHALKRHISPFPSHIAPDPYPGRSETPSMYSFALTPPST